MQIIFNGFAAVAAAMMGFSVHAENLLFNSGFELEDAGYATIKYMRPETNKEMKYEGPVVDTSTFVSGKQSLHIPNRFAEQVRFVAREVILKPDSEYTLSLWMKSSIANCPVNINVVSATMDGWDVKIKEFMVGKEWKQSVFTFKTGVNKLNKFYTFQLYYCRQKDSPAADLWLDDLQLNAGKSQPYQPAATVEIAAVPGQKLYIKDESGKSAIVNVVAVNYSAETVKSQISLDVIADNSGNYAEDFFGEKTVVPVGTIELAPHEKIVIPVKIPLAKFGAYYVNPVAGGRPAPRIGGGYFAVVGKYDRKPVDLNKTFCVGINIGGLGFGRPPRPDFNKTAFYGEGGNQDDLMGLFAAMGCRLMRDWDFPNPAFHWSSLEPAEGKYDFPLADRTVDLALKYGMEIMPVLGESDILCPVKMDTVAGLPAWVITKSTAAKTPDFAKKQGNQTYLPPMNYWRNFIRIIAERYKGKISHYEIMNEPNLFLEPAAYLGYLKTAYEEIKTVDRNTNVVGFCSTGDLGGNVEGFINNCFKDGGLNYVDIVSFHPYDAPKLQGITAADKQISAVRALIEKYGGKNYPLWNSELYYLTGIGVTNPNSNYVERGYFQPHDAAQRFLTDLGEGIGQSTCIQWHELFKNKVAPHFVSSLGSISDQAPNSNYVVYNALARMFEGAKPVDKFRWGKDAICYVYERGGKYLAAFWNYGSQKPLKLLLAASDADAQLYDIYGSPLSLKALPLELTAAPYYLECKGNDFDKFVKLLKNAKIEADKPVIPATLVRLLPENGGWTAAVGLKNCAGIAVSGKLGINGNGIVTLNSVEFSLPADAEQTVKVPVKLKNDSPGKIDIKIYTGDKLWSFPAEVYPPAQICPATGKPEQIMKDVRTTKATHQAVFRANYDENNLLLTIDVKDKTPSGSPGDRKPYEQDCVELFIDANPGYLPTRHMTAYHGQVARLFVTPYAPEGQRLIIWPRELKKLTIKTVKLQTELTPDGYTVKLVIPFEALELMLPVKGKCIGFDIAVDNADGAKITETVLCWNSPGKAHLDRCSFGFIKFE